jgi:anti-sigma regulatory factor (Ser/Thr protein kinase)
MKFCVLVDPHRKKDIEKLIQSIGWDLFFLPSDEKASSMAIEFKPDCLLVDENLKEFDSFEMCKKVRELSPSDELPIFMIASKKSMIEDIDVLRFGIDNMIPNNLSSDQFKDMIEEKILVKKSIKKNEFVEDWIEFEIDNDIRFVKEVHSLVEKLINRSKLSPTQIFKLEYSFKEMLQNAWEHGNSKDINKKIKISYVLFEDRLVIKITDEGSGFILDTVEDPTVDPIGAMQRRQAEGKRAGGWGIASVRKLMDELIFSDRGNVVLMVKYLNSNKEKEEEVEEESAGED